MGEEMFAVLSFTPVHAWAVYTGYKVAKMLE